MWLVDARKNWYYYNYTLQAYTNTVNNGYPSSKVIFGMISSEFNQSNFDDACNTLKNISKEYPNFNGVFNWEYFDSPPNKKDPSEWADLIRKAICY